MGWLRKKLRLTLAQIMVANVVVALLLAAARLGPAGLAALAGFVAFGWGLLVLAIVINLQLDAIVGIECPRCRRRELRRLALSFRVPHAFFECAACGMRCKRKSPFSRWLDASGPEDAKRYRRKSISGNWLGYSIPEVDDSTCGTLLRGKRLRASSHAAEDARGK